MRTTSNVPGLASRPSNNKRRNAKWLPPLPLKSQQHRPCFPLPPLLDEVYKAESKTAILDTAQDRVRWSDEYHTFYLFETDMVGLGDYSRNGGFVRGDVTAQWSLRTPVGSWSAVPR